MTNDEARRVVMNSNSKSSGNGSADDADSASADDLQADNLLRCPSEGWDFPTAYALYCTRWKWRSTADRDEGLIFEPLFPEFDSTSALHGRLLMGELVAVGTTSLNAEPRAISKEEWRDLRLLPYEVDGFFEYIAEAPSKEAFFRLRYFPPDHASLTDQQRTVSRTPIVRRTLPKDAKKIDVIRFAFQELMSKDPALDHIYRPPAKPPYPTQWRDALHAHARELAVLSGLAVEISKRQVADYLAEREQRDAIRAYLGLTGNST
jgi:hypothetical protein